VSDIAMPNEDGYALIGKVRKLEEKRMRRIPALALPGDGQGHEAVVIDGSIPANPLLPAGPRLSTRGLYR
jgi:CheY-like chemotaxis protein